MYPAYKKDIVTELSDLNANFSLSQLFKKPSINFKN